MSAAPNLRLDELLVKNGLAETRSQAKSLIMAGRVRIGTAVLDKPGKSLPEDAKVELLRSPRFVGRGGEKLAHALDFFKIDCRGKTGLDIGASTGGFTDCLLQAGAESVTCVDVGHGQLHSKLRDNPAVANIEKVNARHLKPGDLPRDAYDIITIDVSFISLRIVLPAVWQFLAGGGILVALVKPQFEAQKQEADKAEGVIRDRGIQERALAEVEKFVMDQLPGAERLGSTDSPMLGAEGNREFLLALRKKPQGAAL